MLPWYQLKIERGQKYQKIEDIQYSDFNKKIVKIKLFTLNELIKIYPNFKRSGEYIIFNEDLFFNYQNYLLFEKSPLFGGNDKLNLWSNIQQGDLIPGNEFKLCLFAKYPFKDLYINSGLYIYNWMIKEISTYQFILRSGGRFEIGRKIDSLFKSKLVLHEGRTFENSPAFEANVIETTEGFILKW